MMRRNQVSNRSGRIVVGPETFADVYRSHARDILVFLTRRTRDPETALDLTAETFAQAFQSRQRFRGSSDDELAAWLFGIARHLLARTVRRGLSEQRALRRLGVDVPPLEPEDASRILEVAGLEDLRCVVARELDALSPSHREAVRLRVVEELPYADVARGLGVSEATARARVSRGLRTLGTAVDKGRPEGSLI